MFTIVKLIFRLNDINNGDTFSDIKISYYPENTNNFKVSHKDDIISVSSSIYSIELLRKYNEKSNVYQTFLKIKNSQQQNQALLNLDYGGILKNNI